MLSTLSTQRKANEIFQNFYILTECNQNPAFVSTSTEINQKSGRFCLPLKYIYTMKKLE